MSKKYVELEPNRTHNCEEPELCDLGSCDIWQICKLAQICAFNSVISCSHMQSKHKGLMSFVA